MREFLVFLNSFREEKNLASFIIMHSFNACTVHVKIVKCSSCMFFFCTISIFMYYAEPTWRDTVNFLYKNGKQDSHIV